MYREETSILCMNNSYTQDMVFLGQQKSSLNR